MDIALLIVRLIVGLALAAHGSQKLFGWFGGHGIAGTGGFFESVGFRPGYFFAAMAGISEIGGGLLTALGLFGAAGPALIVMVMLVAIFAVHVTHGFFADKGGYELPLAYVAGALALAFTGPGTYSLDRAFNLAFLADHTQVWYAIAAAAILATLNLVVARASHGATVSR